MATGIERPGQSKLPKPNYLTDEAGLGSPDTPRGFEDTGREIDEDNIGSSHPRKLEQPPPAPKERWRGDTAKTNPEPPVQQASEQHRLAAKSAIDNVKQGSHFSDNVSKYLDNFANEVARRTAMPKACQRFNASTFENDLDYGDALKYSRLSPSRLTTGITDGLYQRMKIGGEAPVLSRLKAVFSRQDIIAARGEIIKALRLRAREESKRPAVSELLRQLSQELQTTNDRDMMLAEKKWWQRPFTDLSDRALAAWWQDKADQNKIYDAEVEQLLDQSRTVENREELPPIKLDDD